MKRAAGLFVCLVLLGCGPTGYITDDSLESGERGPAQCASRCDELGMTMGAFVMVNHGYAGCVCTPVPSSGAATLGAAGQTGAVIAATEAIEARRRQQRRQQRR